MVTYPNNKRGVAETWSTGGIGYVGMSKVRSIRDNLDDYLDIFINDYLTANPK
jgi:hypothetical protein